jgi:Mrp family chromosome partitioning ATPase
MTRIYNALQLRQQQQQQTETRRVAPRLVATTLSRETLLSLYSSVEARLPAGAPRSIEIISSTHGEGTSTIARDLAVTVADEVGKRVMLVTIINPKFGRPRDAVTVGLEAVIAGHAELAEVVEEVPGTPLVETTLAVGGEANRNLFDGPALDALLKAALATVDLLIIDAPPALADVAGVALARSVGGTVLVVEAERTRAPIVDQARHLIESHGGHILGVIMNKRRFHIPSAIYRRL